MRARSKQPANIRWRGREREKPRSEKSLQRVKHNIVRGHQAWARVYVELPVPRGRVSE